VRIWIDFQSFLIRRANWIGFAYFPIARAAEKMRRQSLASAHVSVFLETNRFRPDRPQYHPTLVMRLPVASADTGTRASWNDFLCD
jgi:hypothetical protein